MKWGLTGTINPAGMSQKDESDSGCKMSKTLAYFKFRATIANSRIPLVLPKLILGLYTATRALQS